MANQSKEIEPKLYKPFLKWVGGKTQIIHNIINHFPKEMNNYHELFLGGGSVLLALLSLQRQNKIIIHNNIYVYDINERLINVYKHIQNNKDELFEFIEKYINEYDSIQGDEINRNPKTIDEAKTSKESYYYWMRRRFNNIDKNIIESSALFMCINKTCFRGMYREGPNGYNVPFGHYKKTPIIITKNVLDEISEIIQNVSFIHSGFNDSIKNIKSDDFVYLDPPYAPENKTSFVGYVSSGFSLEDHITLFDSVKKMNEQNIKFVLSNAKVELVTQSFCNFKFDDIIARRAINSKNPQATTTEVIIYN